MVLIHPDSGRGSAVSGAFSRYFMVDTPALAITCPRCKFFPVGPRITVLWVLPDYFEDLPKPCVGGWGRTTILIAPNGEALPCHAASTIPGLEFPDVREHSLDWIWHEADAFTRFRGTEWMQEPCRSCPLGRQEEDWGGCRCQALRLTGDARATDPVCRFSPHHDVVVSAREPGQTDEFVYRTLRRRRRATPPLRAR